MATEMTFGTAIQQALYEELERDERVFVMGQDIAQFGGVFRKTAGLYEKFGPRRVINTPISETFIIAGGLGAAITGLRPIVELQYADFVGIAMDEIFNKVAKWRYMHGGVFTSPMVIRAEEGAIGGAGPEHSQCPEGLFWGAAGLHVVIPSTPADAKGLLKTAVRDDNPTIFFEHKALSNTRGLVPDGEHLVPLGTCDVKRSGTDVSIIAWSSMVPKALSAAEELAEEGVSVEVVDPRGMRPLDVDGILKSVIKTGRVLIAHEATKTGGPGGEVAALIAEEALESLAAPIARVASPDVPMPQSTHLEAMVVPGTADIVRGVRNLVDR